jgi:hypothetical protein
MKFSFGNNGHMVTCERQLAVGVDWRDHRSRRARSFPLGRHLDFYQRAEQEASGREDSDAGMQELGHGKQRWLKAQLLWDILEPDTVSKSAQSSPGSYFQKSRRATSSLGYHPQNNSCGRLSLGVDSKTLISYSIARHYL